VLTFLAMFDLNRFPDRKKHPNILFGQPKALLDYFVEDQKEDEEDKEDPQKNGPHIFDRIIPFTHEILGLSDRIKKKGMPHFSKLKVGNSKTQNRAGSEKNKEKPAHFDGGVIGGAFMHGWLCPMLAAFRANLDRTAWAKGRFKWVQNPEKLLGATVDEMSELVKQEHNDNKQKPAEVGRKEAAYRLCYGVLRDQLHESTD